MDRGGGRTDFDSLYLYALGASSQGWNNAGAEGEGAEEFRSFLGIEYRTDLPEQLALSVKVAAKNRGRKGTKKKKELLILRTPFLVEQI